MIGPILGFFLVYLSWLKIWFLLKNMVQNHIRIEYYICKYLASIQVASLKVMRTMQGCLGQKVKSKRAMNSRIYGRAVAILHDFKQ